MENNYLTHYGIRGMKWGVRRFENPDGTLTDRGRKRYKRLDDKFVKNKSDKIYKKALKKSEKEMKKFIKKDLKNESGRTAINKYNTKLAEVMRNKTKDIRSPSGKIIEWVAKRGDVGVFMALADQDYNITQLKQGVWSDGRVGYRQTKVDMQEGT